MRRPRCCAFLLTLGLVACAAPTPAPGPAPTSTAPSVDTLVVLATTDVHGWLLPTDYVRGESVPFGLARLAPLIDSVRARHPGATLLVDAGDFLQGTPLAYVHARAAGPHPVVTAMNALGYDAAAVGNHEFNYGLDVLERVRRQARFPWLSANIFHTGTDTPAFAPFVMVERRLRAGTVRVALVGATTPGVAIWDRDHVRGRLAFRSVVDGVGRAVAAARGAGADLVIVVAHSGLEGSSYDTAQFRLPAENAVRAMARQVPGIDVVVFGHTHREFVGEEGSVLLVQPRNWAQSLGAITLVLERQAAGWRLRGRRAVLLRPDPSRVGSALLRLLAAADVRTRAYVAQPLGRSPVEWSAQRARVEDTPLLDFVNEVQRRVTGAQLAATAAFSLSARLPAGTIRMADLFALYPYDNTLRVVRISGAQLRAYLEKTAEYFLPCPGGRCERIVNPAIPGYNYDVISGVDYTLDLRQPVGHRVVELRYRGRPVEPTDTFTLALNNYRANGGGGYAMLAEAPVVRRVDREVRDLLAEEIVRRGEVRPEMYAQRNWRLVPAELAAQVQAELAPSGGATGRETRLWVWAVNDFHGNLQPLRPSWARGAAVGGLATLGGYLARERVAAGGVPVLALDAGDVMQGTALSNLTWGRATVAGYNRLGIAAAAIGNHEFDWGVDTLRARIAEARFPWLAANVTVAGTDTAPSWIRPTTIVALPACARGAPACDTVRVGLLGLTTTSTPRTTRPSNVRTLAFGDLATALDRWVPRLRAAGVDFVVAIAHAGGRCDVQGCEGEVLDAVRRARARPDLVVSGHTHTVFATEVAGTLVVQQGEYGTRYSLVELQRDPSGRVRARVLRQPITFVDSVRADTGLARLVAEAEAQAGPRLRAVVTVLDRPWTRTGPEYPLGWLIADAQRAAAGADVAIMNNGGIRIDLPPGAVTFGDLYRLQPFQNTLVILWLSGAELRQALEHGLRGARPSIHVSGLRVTYDPGAPPGQRVRRLLREDGRPIGETDTVRVVVNDFLAEGGDGFAVFAQARRREFTGIVDLDALVAYVQRLPRPLPLPSGPRLLIQTSPAARLNPSTRDQRMVVR